MLNNDERYWDINLLNKWFAISSVVFLASMVWTFIDDNDDEFKEFQKEFRKLEIEISEAKLEKELEIIKSERIDYEKRLEIEQNNFENYKEELDKLESKLKILNGKYYNNNMIYQGQKAEIDALKYLVETDNAHGGHDSSYGIKYTKEKELLDSYRINKESTEIEIGTTEQNIKELKSDLKQKQSELEGFTKKADLLENKLSKIDREKMSFANKIADFVRDLPILDFMDPYYKVNQIVVSEVKYDVNFAAVPKVDRCTSCHLGIDNPDFSDAPQPYTTHPNLDLYITSASPHPMNSFACTSCHDGRGRGTTFISSTHTPNTDEDKERWKKEYDWEKMHHWLQPMLPTRYTQASCFKCHTNTSDLAGGEKLNFGLSLIDAAGCNGCHNNANWPSLAKTGPDLRNINKKLTKDWVEKWIKNPKHFRHNTRMPAIFEQENQESPEVSAYNDVEIAGITEYLFNNKEINRGKNSNRYIGNAENGEKLFNAIGCMGCHVSENDPLSAPLISNYEDLTKVHGPNLIGLGSKVTAEWLYKWLMNPQEYMPTTKMPNLRLSPDQAKDLTAYLLNNRNKEFEDSPSHKYDPSVLEELTVNWFKKSNPEKFAIVKAEKMDQQEKLNFIGEKSIRHYGCFGCHHINGFENAKPIGVEITEEGSKPVNKFDFGLHHDIPHTNYDWIENKLRTPRIYDRDKESQHLDLLKMPNFYFSEEEIEAITTAVLSFNADKVGGPLLAHLKEPDIVKNGHRLVKQYNCQGCHQIENRGGQLVNIISAPEYAPPNLNSEGRKAQPDWLLSFFNNPSIIRPNLQVRMPSFHQIPDKEWNTIIRYFQYIDSEKISYRGEFAFDNNSIEYHAGEKLHELGACNNCHFYGETFPTQEASTWAPNLAMMKERLNPEWVKEFLRDPQAIMPGTKMPAPYLPDKDILAMDGAENDWGKELVKLGGDSTAMLNGLRNYLWDIKGKTNIDEIIKEYFDENGYEFAGDDDDFEDEDDWGDDEDW